VCVRLSGRVFGPTNGVIERFFGTLNYEHLFRARAMASVFDCEPGGGTR
jgi:hypothetical protein